MSARASTQQQRVLAALRYAGTAGVSQMDFLVPQVVDGGPPIWRLPARVNELRRAGYRIASHVDRIGGARVARYVLIAEPATTTATVDPAEPAALALDIGDASARPRPRSPLDPESEA